MRLVDISSQNRLTKRNGVRKLLKAVLTWVSNLLFKKQTLLPSGSEQDQVLRGTSIPNEYLVIGELGVKDVLKVVRFVCNGSI